MSSRRNHAKWACRNLQAARQPATAPRVKRVDTTAGRKTLYIPLRAEHKPTLDELVHPHDDQHQSLLANLTWMHDLVSPASIHVKHQNPPIIGLLLPTESKMPGLSQENARSWSRKHRRSSKLWQRPLQRSPARVSASPRSQGFLSGL